MLCQIVSSWGADCVHRLLLPYELKQHAVCIGTLQYAPADGRPAHSQVACCVYHVQLYDGQSELGIDKYDHAAAA